MWRCKQGGAGSFYTYRVIELVVPSKLKDLDDLGQGAVGDVLDSEDSKHYLQPGFTMVFCGCHNDLAEWQD